MRHNQCDDKHEGMVVLHGFSEGDCDVCGEVFYTPHTPGNKVCTSCGDEHNICVVCGKELVKEEE